PPPTPANVTVTPSTQNFGSVTVGGSIDHAFTTMNSGGSTVSGAATATAPFTVISGGAFVLGPGGTQTIVVRFNPTTAGAFGTNVTFSWTGGSANAAVTGTGTAPALPPPPLPPPSPPPPPP